MKVLIINQDFSNFGGEFGGVVGVNRNTNLLRKILGEDNIEVYNIPMYKNKIYMFLYWLFGYTAGLTSKNIREIKRMLLYRKFEIVFLNSSLFGKIAKSIRKNRMPVITFFHNIEINYYKSFYEKRKKIKKLWYHISKYNILNSEKNSILYSKKVMVLNNRDSYEVEKIYHRIPDFILPVTFYDVYNNNVALQSKSLNNKQLLFVGLDSPLNTDGLFWFIENCFDEINACLLVVGIGMEKYRNRYSQKKVNFIGYVENISTYYYQADAVVLPILSGSGMKTKTCEALMYGKTIFGTTEAFQGYEAIDFTEHKWLCNSPVEFIENINDFLLNDQSRINEYSRNIFLNNYSTIIFESKLYNFLTYC
jgi:hypothetical protein